MKASFDTVYQEHYDKLYTLALRMTGRPEDAEDVLQTSFLNAYKVYERFRNESSTYTWLYRIVLNASKKYNKELRRLPIKKYSEEHQIPLAEVYAYINSFGRTEDTVVANRFRETCLQMFMSCMPSKYRAVYTLRVVLDFSIHETAEIFDIKGNTVKVNLNRARKIIKSHMDGRCSLIKPGSMCDCRSYAKFFRETKCTPLLLNIEAVSQKERRAIEEFTHELREILNFDELYQTRIKGLDYAAFQERVKQLRKEKQLKVLKY